MNNTFSVKPPSVLFVAAAVLSNGAGAANVTGVNRTRETGVFKPAVFIK